jgi:hypothetical protein
MEKTTMLIEYKPSGSRAAPSVSTDYYVVIQSISDILDERVPEGESQQFFVDKFAGDINLKQNTGYPASYSLMGVFCPADITIGMKEGNYYEQSIIDEALASDNSGMPLETVNLGKFRYIENGTYSRSFSYTPPKRLKGAFHGNDDSDKWAFNLLLVQRCPLAAGSQSTVYYVGDLKISGSIRKRKIVGVSV